ncbi:MAG: hypothetical protein L0271_00795 [Gemmatimonadetes bacterium]|nr:hypothetical protein [Gemmatimonadota bacterium]
MPTAALPLRDAAAVAGGTPDRPVLSAVESIRAGVINNGDSLAGCAGASPVARASGASPPQLEHASVSTMAKTMRARGPRAPNDKARFIAAAIPGKREGRSSMICRNAAVHRSVENNHPYSAFSALSVVDDLFIPIRG